MAGSQSNGITNSQALGREGRQSPQPRLLSMGGCNETLIKPLTWLLVMGQEQLEEPVK